MNNNKYKSNFIGSLIKQRRIYLKISQVKLSKSLDISPSYLNLIESGKRELTEKLLNKITKKLEISIDDLTPKKNAELLKILSFFFNSELFHNQSITSSDINNLINNNIKIAEALSTAHNKIIMKDKKKKNQTEQYRSERYGLVLRKSID